MMKRLLILLLGVLLLAGCGASQPENTPKNIKVDAESALKKANTEMGNLLNKVEKAVNDPEYTAQSIQQKSMQAFYKYSYRYEEEKKEPQQKLWEHFDRQMLSLSGAPVAFCANGRMYGDLDEIKSLPEEIRQKASLYLQSFNNLFDVYVFAVQYYEGGEGIKQEKLTTESGVTTFKTPPDGEVKYEIKDVGGRYGIFVSGVEVSPQQLEQKFVQAARERYEQAQQLPD